MFYLLGDQIRKVEVSSDLHCIIAVYIMCMSYELEIRFSRSVKHTHITCYFMMFYYLTNFHYVALCGRKC